MLAALYRERLTATSVRVPPELDAGHVYHLFPIRTTARDRLREHLGARDIDTLIHYPVPLPAHPAFAGAVPQPCPIAATVCGELISLPLYPGLDDEAVTRVVDAIANFPEA
jgi:dTDP-4-amino-4,6-dideoxygalactose transaminase